jgi:hypothetical protein
MDADGATDTATGAAADTTTAPGGEISGGDAPRSIPDGAEPADALGPTVENPDGSTWSPPAMDPKTGIALDGPGGLPVNHRLRAERLALDGKETDEGGYVSDELIADARDRLDRIRESIQPVRENMKTADLERIAEDEGVDLTGATNNAERVRRIEAARPELPGMDSLKAYEESR